MLPTISGMMPSGTTLTYRQAAEVIEEVAEDKVRQFRKIAWLDDDDIRQEVRMKCLLTLSKYDSAKADLHTFLSRCAENRLRDVRRGVIYKHNRPCFRCPFWDSAAYRSGGHDCGVFADKMDCDRYARHERYVHAKLSVSRPVSLDEDKLQDHGHEQEVEGSELLEYIYARLPAEHRESFHAFEVSGFNLKVLRPQQRIRLIEIIVAIVEEFQEESHD